jgi:hypothetical protein
MKKIIMWVHDIISNMRIKIARQIRHRKKYKKMRDQDPFIYK